MEPIRKPFGGVWNIIRFNRQFYIAVLILTATILFLERYAPPYLRGAISYAVMAALLLLFVSLLVSWYIYDYSPLYRLSWLDSISVDSTSHIINIHAGFDETSPYLKRRFPLAKLTVLDFYDAKRHTEVSIRRARKAYPPFPGTVAMTTGNLPLLNGAADIVLIFLSAHEIRHTAERIQFFKELHRILAPSGQVIVTEHLRNLPNFAAYNIGAFHFHSRSTWLQAFREAGFHVRSETGTTPFITTFILVKHGIAS